MSLTAEHRRLLERFAVGDLPLNRAIACALAELDRCRDCEGTGRLVRLLWRATGTGCATDMQGRPVRATIECPACGGTGKQTDRS